MSKHAIKEITGQAFAHSAYVAEGDGDYSVVGKFAEASYHGNGYWDVWLRNGADMAKGLSTRKLNNLINAISGQKNALAGPLQRLEGEAIYPRMPTDTFIRIAPVLGIKKRRKATGIASQSINHDMECYR